jgi:UDP-3-O-[3-hydroxymyristoyl] glucosamine N-acyltransferase
VLTQGREPKYAVLKGMEIGEGTKIYDQVNLFGCKIGKNSKIDSFVYIEEGVTIGDNCKIRPFVFIPSVISYGILSTVSSSRAAFSNFLIRYFGIMRPHPYL